ncbi:MAG: hypothetical protein MZU91_11700 [Desulfosudis oleivorans]|nr:hypothetical protein [Desulfosudis oleivorans]
MAFLCVNKQLDLQSLFTDLGRVLARQGGWFDQRRVVQLWFVLAGAASGLAALAFMAWRVRPILKESLLLLIGLSSLLTFIVIRAASFHHVDVLLRSQLLGVRVNWVLELGGIGLIVLSALQALLRARTD